MVPLETSWTSYAQGHHEAGRWSDAGVCLGDLIGYNKAYCACLVFVGYILTYCKYVNIYRYTCTQIYTSYIYLHCTCTYYTCVFIYTFSMLFPLPTNSTIFLHGFSSHVSIHPMASRSMDFYELRSNPVLLKEAKMRGFSDRQIAALVSIPEKILVECTLAKMDLLVGLSHYFNVFF